jgi:peroxiredoxin
MLPLMPRQPVPDLTLETLTGETWQLSLVTPETFTLIVFYRGLHCPICRSYLGDLEGHLNELSTLGVAVIAASSDTQARAQETVESWIS